MTMMNQSQYAQHSGVDRKTIGRWIKAGRFIVMDGDLIDVEASDVALKKNRDGKDPRASNAKKRKRRRSLMMSVMKLKTLPENYPYRRCRSYPGGSRAGARKLYGSAGQTSV